MKRHNPQGYCDSCGAVVRIRTLKDGSRVPFPHVRSGHSRERTPPRCNGHTMKAREIFS
jgi:hypothetical protein